MGHRSTSATLLAKIALKREKHLIWDAKNERITNDGEANKLLTYEYRAPWQLVEGPHDIRARAVTFDGTAIWSDTARITVWPP